MTVWERFEIVAVTLLAIAGMLVVAGFLCVGIWLALVRLTA